MFFTIRDDTVQLNTTETDSRSIGTIENEIHFIACSAQIQSNNLRKVFAVNELGETLGMTENGIR